LINFFTNGISFLSNTSGKKASLITFSGSLACLVDAYFFASFLLFSLGVLIFNYLNFGFVNALSYSFGMASLPMVVLFITGSFGGYFSEDLSLFSLLTNRIKGLFIAIAMLSMAYLIFNLG